MRETDMTDVVSSFEAAQILQCTPDNIRRLAREGRLRAVISTGAGRLFSRRDIEALAEARAKAATPTPSPEAA
jgi:excisionase family DNA binding protein